MAERVRGVRFSLRVAWRYLFSKKSHNAVNIITGISSAGIAVGAMAMVCVRRMVRRFLSRSITSPTRAPWMTPHSVWLNNSALLVLL